MERPCNEIPLEDDVLADVIELGERGRSRPCSTPSLPDVAERHGAEGGDPTERRRRGAALLHRRYGDRWATLPSDLGRAAVRLETLLSQGPTALDPETASPDQVVVEAWLVVRAAAAQAGILAEEADVLGEALGADLAALDLRRLDLVAGAVIDLGLVRRGEASWAEPSDADVALVMLDANGPELRRAAEVHRDVYERFTEEVWDVPEARLRTGRQGWRLFARLRLRRELGAASRTGRRSRPLSDDVELLLEARAARVRLAELGPLLQRHLGRHHQGPLTDVDAAEASLEAVVRLQDAMGDHLDVDRLRGLLLADAFTSSEVTNPAMTLHTTLRAWAAEVARLCGGDPWALPAGALGEWARRTGSALPLVAAAVHAMTELGRAPSTLRDMVDDLVLREHLGEVEQAAPETRSAEPAAARSGEGSAS